MLFSSVSAANQAEPERVDRILATVDDDPILESDLQQLMRFGLATRQPDESDGAFERRVLETAIEERLRFHEIDRFGSESVPAEQVEQEIARLRSSMASGGSWRAALHDSDLDEDSVRQLVARQLMVLIYVEERLGPRVFVSLEDIQQYYEQTLVPNLRQRDAEVPALSGLREQIRGVLKEQRLNQEIDRWTEELRAAADVVNYIDNDRQELPPVIQ